MSRLSLVVGSSTECSKEEALVRKGGHQLKPGSHESGRHQYLVDFVLEVNGGKRSRHL